MKKLYVISAALLLAQAGIAQTEAEVNKATVKSLKSKAVNPGVNVGCGDTIGLVNFTDFAPEFAALSGQPVIYGYTGGGYIYGNNVSTNGLKIVAQGYSNVNSTPVVIQGVVLWFGAKESDSTSSATSKVTLSVYNVTPNQSYNTNSSGTFNAATKNYDGPTGTALATADLLFSAIDTTDFNYVAFTNPPQVLGDFAVSMDVNGLFAGDTVGLVSDSEDDAQELDYTWHKIGTKWYVTDQLFSPAAAPDLGTGGLNNNIAIFPVVCDATGINEFFNGMKLTAYPNPAVNSINIEYALQADSKNVTLNVFDMSGRVVLNKSLNNQNAGSYKETIETANLQAGSYFYQLKANGFVVTKRFEVQK